MIKTQKGHLQNKGKAQEIIADLTVIMKGCRELFAVRGYDVDDIFKFAIENSFLSAEELEAEENEGGDPDGE